MILVGPFEFRTLCVSVITRGRISGDSSRSLVFGAVGFLEAREPVFVCPAITKTAESVWGAFSNRAHVWRRAGSRKVRLPPVEAIPPPSLSASARSAQQRRLPRRRLPPARGPGRRGGTAVRQGHPGAVRAAGGTPRPWSHGASAAGHARSAAGSEGTARMSRPRRAAGKGEGPGPGMRGRRVGSEEWGCVREWKGGPGEVKRW